MEEIQIVTSEIEPYEYFCPKCLQLRLKLRDDDKCGNCGEPITIKGKLGSLDKESLIAEHKTCKIKELDKAEKTLNERYGKGGPFLFEP